MAEIKRNKLDEFENIIFELNYITYLQALEEYDRSSGRRIIEEFSFLKGTDGYLTQKQIDIVLKLNDLFNSI